MNEMKVFENQEFGEIRAVDVNGEPWLVGKDVADALGYTNPRKALADHVDDEDKNTVTIRDGIPGNPNMTIINESGLYSLVLSSKLPGAKKFRRWVTSEVLPAIREKGTYSLIPKDYPSALRALANEVEKNQKLLEENAAQKEFIESNAPKVTYYDTILQSDEALCITQIASDYALSGKKLNQILASAHIQYKVNAQWVLYSEHRGKGYTVSVTYKYFKGDCSPSSFTKTRWTQKGRLKIHEILTKRGINPRMDLE